MKRFKPGDLWYLFAKQNCYKLLSVYSESEKTDTLNLSQQFVALSPTEPLSVVIIDTAEKKFDIETSEIRTDLCHKVLLTTPDDMVYCGWIFDTQIWDYAKLKKPKD